MSGSVVVDIVEVVGAVVVAVAQPGVPPIACAREDSGQAERQAEREAQQSAPFLFSVLFACPIWQLDPAVRSKPAADLAASSEWRFISSFAIATAPFLLIELAIKENSKRENWKPDKQVSIVWLDAQKGDRETEAGGNKRTSQTAISIRATC